MKLEVETVIEGAQREGCAWGVTNDGRAVFIAIVGSRRVIIEMDYVDALDTCIGGIHVGQGLRMSAAHENAAPPQSMITDARGVPLGGRRG
jgi:hypothetical protein